MPNPRFTFHYGSILIKKSEQKIYTVVKFTFHYGSILMSRYSMSFSIICIYIPLWFYSNTESIKEIGAVINLHSTMVLF